MNETGPTRAYRAILDALGPSPSMARLGFYSKVSGAGFGSMSPAPREAMELATSAAAAQRNELSLLPFLDADPMMVRYANTLNGTRGLYLSKDISKIAYTDLPAEKLEPHEQILLVVKYLSQSRLREALELYRTCWSKFNHPDSTWLVCAAFINFFNGNIEYCRTDIGRLVENMLSLPFGLWDQEFWSVLDLIAPNASEFHTIIAEEIASRALKAAPLDTAKIVTGLAQKVAQDENVSEEFLKQVADAVVSVLSDKTVLSIAPASLVEKGLATATQALERFVASLNADFVALAETLKKDALPEELSSYNLALANWVDAARLLVRVTRNSAMLQFSRGTTQIGTQTWNTALALEHKIRQRTDLKATHTPPSQAETYRIVSTADLFSLSSASEVSVGPAEDLRRNVMSRVDTNPLRSNHQSSSPFCVLLKQASAIFGEREGSIFWYVKTRDKELLADGLNVHPRFHFGSDAERIASVSPSGEALVTPTQAKKTIQLAGTAVLLGGVENYYHWTIEYMPRLHSLRRLFPPEKLANVRYLINFSPASWQLMMLQRAGIPMNSLFPVRGGEEVQCTNLIVPSIPSAADSVSFMREVMDIQPRENTGRKIYVSRLDVHPDRRRVADEEHLAEAMEMAGYEILIPTDVSFDAQIDAFASADVIVGAHGAALTNLTYAAPHTLVVEITNRYNHSYDFFTEITEALGIRHVRYRSGNERPTPDAENAAAVIDPQNLLNFIEAHLQGEADIGEGFQL